jgi:amidase
MSTTLPWEQRVADKRQRQHDSIPKEWLIEIPAEDVLDVTHIPTSCGLLSEKDVEITETTDLNLLLEKLASGIWTSVEVTTAFCKRAVIAHQLVRVLGVLYLLHGAYRMLDQLLDRDLH